MNDDADDRPELSAEAYSFLADPYDDCPVCGHVNGPHLFHSTDDDPSDVLPTAGGVLICPVDRCTCARPIGTATEPGAFGPSDDDLARVQQFIQRLAAERGGRRIGPAQTLTTWRRRDETEDE